MRKLLIPLLAGTALLLSGCAAKTVWDIATMPVKAGSKAVDMATTSQSEADRAYGKKMRKAEEREGRERAEHDKRCREDPKHCKPYDGYRAEDHRDDKD
jgi:uncharacterized protein YceK